MDSRGKRTGSSINNNNQSDDSDDDDDDYKRKPDLDDDDTSGDSDEDYGKKKKPLSSKERKQKKAYAFRDRQKNVNYRSGLRSVVDDRVRDFPPLVMHNAARTTRLLALFDTIDNSHLEGLVSLKPNQRDLIKRYPELYEETKLEVTTEYAHLGVTDRYILRRVWKKFQNKVDHQEYSRMSKDNPELAPKKKTIWETQKRNDKENEDENSAPSQDKSKPSTEKDSKKRSHKKPFHKYFNDSDDDDDAEFCIIM